MTDAEKWGIICDYVITDEETGEHIGISDKAPENAKKIFAEMKAEEEEIDAFTKFALANIIFCDNGEPKGVRDGAPADTMERYNAFVEKYGAFPPLDDY